MVCKPHPPSTPVQVGSHCTKSHSQVLRVPWVQYSENQALLGPSALRKTFPSLPLEWLLSSWKSLPLPHSRTVSEPQWGRKDQHCICVSNREMRPLAFDSANTALSISDAICSSMKQEAEQGLCLKRGVLFSTYPIFKTSFLLPFCHLSWVVDKLQSRVAGDHGTQVGEGACGIQPVLGPIHFDGIKELDH